MKIHYDVKTLEILAENLYELFHLGVLFADRDGNCLAKYYDFQDFCSVMQEKDDTIRCGCQKSDADLIAACQESGYPCAHTCHLNLCDVALPITKQGVLVAYVLLGRMRGANCNEPPAGIDSALADMYYKQPFLTDKALASLKTLLSITLFSGAITLEEPDLLTKIKNHIDDNLSADLSLSAICKQFFVSKNTLYQLFRKEYGCTVGEYISARRLAAAKQRLLETKQPIQSISQDLGFASYTYFCRFFKSGTGLTPGAFRASRESFD